MYAENLISTPEAQADFYPTPKELGKKMLQGIDLGFISTVLEPSAGKGDLIRCLAEESIAQEHRYNPHTLNVDAIEIDPYIRSILKYEFGSARQQEIQHTLRGFEDRTRYDYKLDKEVGLNDEEKTARAQLRYESSLRDRIDLHGRSYCFQCLHEYLRCLFTKRHCVRSFLPIAIFSSYNC